MPVSVTSIAEVDKKVALVNRSVIARSLGLDRSYVSQVLCRKRMPGLDVAAGIAKEVGVSLDQLHRWMVGAGQGSKAVN